MAEKIKFVTVTVNNYGNFSYFAFTKYCSLFKAISEFCISQLESQLTWIKCWFKEKPLSVYIQAMKKVEHLVQTEDLRLPKEAQFSKHFVRLN